MSGADEGHTGWAAEAGEQRPAAGGAAAAGGAPGEASVPPASWAAEAQRAVDCRVQLSPEMSAFAGLADSQDHGPAGSSGDASAAHQAAAAAASVELREPVAAPTWPLPAAVPTKCGTYQPQLQGGEVAAQAALEPAAALASAVAGNPDQQAVLAAAAAAVSAAAAVAAGLGACQVRQHFEKASCPTPAASAEGRWHAEPLDNSAQEAAAKISTQLDQPAELLLPACRAELQQHGFHGKQQQPSGQQQHAEQQQQQGAEQPKVPASAASAAAAAAALEAALATPEAAVATSNKPIAEQQQAPELLAASAQAAAAETAAAAEEQLQHAAPAGIPVPPALAAASDSPAASEPSAAPSSQPAEAAQPPAAEQPAAQQRTIQQPAAQQPAAAQPATEQPSIEVQAAGPPAIQQHAIKQEAAEEPGGEQPSTEQPAVEPPAALHHATKQEAVEQPGGQQPSATLRQPAVAAPHPAPEQSFQLQQLRGFARRSAALFRKRGGGKPERQAGNSTLEQLAARLTARLGPQLLGDLLDDRSEWQRLAGLLSAASGAAVTAEQAEGFFPPTNPAARLNVPDFEAMHAAGLYPAAWPLPLEAQTAGEANRTQHAYQHPPNGFGAGLVGRHVMHFWEQENQWYHGTISAYAKGPPELHTIRYEDGQTANVDLALEVFVFTQAPPPARQQTAAAADQQAATQQAQQAAARQRPGQEQRGQAVVVGGEGLLCMPSLVRGGPSERLRHMVACIKKLLPRARAMAPTKPTGSDISADKQRLREWLGDAPAYDPAGNQDAAAYLQRVLEWGLPAGASLAGCFLQDADNQPGSMSVDMAGLHAAGCFPHAWPVPLSAAGVADANRLAAAAAAADPSSILSTALAAAMAHRTASVHKQAKLGQAAKAAGSGKQPPPAAGAAAGSPVAGGGTQAGPSSSPQWQQQQQQRAAAGAKLLALSNMHRTIPSERLKCLLSSLRKLLPMARETTWRASKDQLVEEVEGEVARILGEAPQFDASEQCPYDFLQQLLEWGAPAGASLAGWVGKGSKPAAAAAAAAGSKEVLTASVDMAALHAAGCFPHLWPVPLSAADVQAANRRGGKAAAADPAALLAGAAAAKWKQHSDGWWQRRLTGTACLRGAHMLSLDAGTFQALTGRLPALPADKLEVCDQATGRVYVLEVRKGAASCHSCLKGTQLGRWVVDSGAREGDTIALKRQDDSVLVKHLPAAPAAAAAAAGRVQAKATKRKRQDSLGGEGVPAPAAREQEQEQQRGEQVDRSHPPQQQQQQQDQAQHGEAKHMLSLAKLLHDCPSELVRCVLSGLKRLVPDARQAALRSRGSATSEAQLLTGLLGEAPPFAAEEQGPFEYLQELLYWGAPPGARLEGCFVSTGQTASVNLVGLHAAGCFPHAWPVPLSTVGVADANRLAAAAAAADPAGAVQAALAAGRQSGRARAQLPTSTKPRKSSAPGGSGGCVAGPGAAMPGSTPTAAMHEGGSDGGSGGMPGQGQDEGECDGGREPAAGQGQQAAGGSGQAQLRLPRSVADALAAPELPPGQKLLGARPPHGTNPHYSVEIKRGDLRASIGRMGRCAATVAADVAATWRRLELEARQRQHAERAAPQVPGIPLNLPESRYEQDEELMGQLRAIGTVAEMQAFLMGIIPQTPSRRYTAKQPQPPPQQQQQQPDQQEGQQQQGGQQQLGQGGAAVDALVLPAAAAGEAEGAMLPAGSRKRKQRPPERVQPWQAAGVGAAAAAAGGNAGAGVAGVATADEAADGLAPLHCSKRQLQQLPSDQLLHAANSPVQQLRQQQQVAAAGGSGGGELHSSNTSVMLPGSTGPGAMAAAAAPAAAAPPQSAGGSGPGPAMVARMADIARRKEQKAIKAFEDADMESADSMLFPLRLLGSMSHGGELLRRVVHRWPGYQLEKQQEVFGAVLLAAGEADWQHLEDRLRLALEAAE